MTDSDSAASGAPDGATKRAMAEGVGAFPAQSTANAALNERSLSGEERLALRLYLADLAASESANQNDVGL